MVNEIEEYLSIPAVLKSVHAGAASEGDSPLINHGVQFEELPHNQQVVLSAFVCCGVSRLARYRPSALRCAPEVADLPISGAFPLRDTERTLAAVVATLPVRRVLDGESETLVRR